MQAMAVEKISFNWEEESDDEVELEYTEESDNADEASAKAAAKAEQVS